MSATGDRYEGYREAPYRVRVNLIENTSTSVRLKVLSHDILVDADTLTQYDPIEPVNGVSPSSISLFKNFPVNETLIITTRFHNDHTIRSDGKRSERILDVVSVEENKIDPLGVDIFKTFMAANIVIYLFVVTLFIKIRFRKTIRFGLSFLTRLIR